MSKTIQVPEDDWNKMLLTQQRIEIALAGDPILKTKGIVDRVGELEIKVQKTEDLKNKGWGLLAVLTFISGILSLGIKELFHYMFFKN